MTLYTCPGPLRTFAFVLVVIVGLHEVTVGLGVSDAVTVKTGVAVSVGVEAEDGVSVREAVVGTSSDGAPVGRLQLMIARQMVRIESKALLLSMISPLDILSIEHKVYSIAL